MTHVLKIDEMLSKSDGSILEFLKKNLKKDMSTSEVLFAVCTRMEWKPAGGGYSYMEKMMRYAFSEDGSETKYPLLETYFECKKTGEDEDGSWVKADKMKEAVLWSSRTKRTVIVGKKDKK